MKLKYTCSCLMAALLLVITACAFFFEILRSEILSSPEEYPLQLTEKLMQAVATNEGQPLPNDLFLPVYERHPVAECWDELQEMMAANDQQYSIELIRAIGDAQHPAPGVTGAEEVVIHVIFEDTRRVELYFYAGGLDYCMEPRDE